MADGYIQLPNDGVGKRLRTQSRDQGGVDVHEQQVGLVDADGNSITTSAGAGDKQLLDVNLAAEADVNITNPALVTKTNSTHDVLTDPIGADADAVSAVFDTLNGGAGMAIVCSSATEGTLYYEESPDNLTWVILTEEAFAADHVHSDTHVAHMRYLRVRFHNGDDANAGGADFLLAVTQREHAGTTTVNLGNEQNAVSLIDPTSGQTAKLDWNGSQKVVITDETGTAFSTYTPQRELRTADSPTDVLANLLDNDVIETTNRWYSSGSGGAAGNFNSATRPSAEVEDAIVTLSTDATANQGVALVTRYAPSLGGQGRLNVQFVVKFEVGAAGKLTEGTHRFVGIGKAPATWRAVAGGAPDSEGPLQHAIGFEVAPDGLLYGVIYGDGARTAFPIPTTPIDGAWHLLWFTASGTTVRWYAMTNPVAPAVPYIIDQQFVTPGELALPLRLHQLTSATTPPAGEVQTQVMNPSVAELPETHMAIADGTFPWRKAKVDTLGSQQHTLTSPNGPAAGLFATLTGYGYQRVSLEPRMLFSDPFDGAVVDVTTRWATTTVGSGTVTQNSGALILGTSTTASNGAAVSSQPTFTPPGLNFNAMGFTAKFEASPAATTNAHRFIGFGTVPATWQATVGTPGSQGPLLDGIGFELDTAGVFSGVVYAAGVRIGQVNLAARLPTDGGWHRYIVVVRADLILFYVDSTEAPVGSLSYTQPNSQLLPIRIHQLNHTDVPNLAPLLQVGALGVHETGGNETQLSDGTYPWRKARIDATGNLAATLGAGTAAIGHIDGQGVAGSPTGGVLTVQGNPAGTPIPVSSPGGSQEATQQTMLDRLENLLEVHYRMLAGAGQQPHDGSGRTRSTVEGIAAGTVLPTVTTVTTVTGVTTVTTVATVTTVGAVTRLNQLGPFPVDALPHALMNGSSADQIRRQITVS